AAAHSATTRFALAASTCCGPDSTTPSLPARRFTIVARPAPFTANSYRSPSPPRHHTPYSPAPSTSSAFALTITPPSGSLRGADFHSRHPSCTASTYPSPSRSAVPASDAPTSQASANALSYGQVSASTRPRPTTTPATTRAATTPPPAHHRHRPFRTP